MATGCALDTDSLGVLEVGSVVRVVEVSGAGRWTGGERVLRLRCDDPLELADPLRPFTAKWYGQATADTCAADVYRVFARHSRRLCLCGAAAGL